MRYCIFLLLILHLFIPGWCQTSTPSALLVKPPIDSAAIAAWSDLLESEPIVSSDGRYFMYSIYNLPVGSNTLVIQSTSNNWKRRFIGANPGIFSFDSKQAIFQSRDTLFFVSLGNDNQQYFTGVSSYTYPKGQFNITNPNRGIIIYKLKQGNEVIISNQVSGKELKIDSVSNFLLNESGKALLIKKLNKVASVETLQWMDIGSGLIKTIWSSKDNRIWSFQFDGNGEQVVFLTQDSGRAKTIWHYKQGMEKAKIKATGQTPGIDSGMMISNSAPYFSKDGRYIFFNTQHKLQPQIKPAPTGVQVDVWNHKDLVLQPLQSFFKTNNEELPQNYIKTKFLSCIAVDGAQVRILENDSIRIAGNFMGERGFIITTIYKNTGDRAWGRYQKIPYYITSLKNEKCHYLTSSVKYFDFWLSPNGKFLIYFDIDKTHYRSYDILEGVTKDISSSIAVKLTSDEMDQNIDPNPFPAGIAGWTGNGALLIYDNWDLWMLDPSGKAVPKCITNGYGRAHNIKFELMPEKGSAGEAAIFPAGKPLLLTGLNDSTKENSFYKVDMNKKGDPELLSTHNCLIYATSKQSFGLNFTVSKVKAEKADLWIVKKQTASNAPNFYSTKDFRRFKQLTDLQPQKNYRWMTSEILSWKMPDGKRCQGILYKPEGFEPGKKYPVALLYYKKETGKLHQFVRPNLVTTDINIPWFVSRGYLVLTPDIHYTIGKVAQSVVNSIAPGIKELIKLSFVDSSAIGIQGHSLGGYETNVLITETPLFAAAVTGAGANDLISQYGSLLPTSRDNGQGSSLQERGGAYRLKASMWEDQNAYIENSPIFKADKVTTPLLIMHNRGDEAVPWGQAVELFIALRRLQKPVWMLQFDGEGHAVENVENQMDYTRRITQFFDHYLKGAPAPVWMTRGIPATMKGMVTGYELDPGGNCGVEGQGCKVCSKWNEKYKLKPSMFNKLSSEWYLDKDTQKQYNGLITERKGSHIKDDFPFYN